MNKIQDIEEQEKLKSLVPELNKKFSDAPAEDIVGYFLQAFKGCIALSSSLSIEDQTLTDIIVKTDKSAASSPSIPADSFRKPTSSSTRQT